MKGILLVDPEKCTLCKSCMLACSLVKAKECNPMRSRIGVVRVLESGLNIPVVCRQCAKPLCADVCPTGAITRKEETGAMVVRSELCVGCQMCTIACPLAGISMDPSGETAVKCDLCDGDPMCVKNCAYEALTFLAGSEATYKKRREAIQKLASALEKIVE
jgi:anaerobic carbon-monoxide dehydrogenase iron sulfur subunit